MVQQVQDDGSFAANSSDSNAQSSAYAYNADNNYSSASINFKGSQVLSELTSHAKSKVLLHKKDINTKYDSTGKMKGTYAASVTTFEKFDAQLDLKGKSTKAVEATKSGISSMYRQISGLWGIHWNF